MKYERDIIQLNETQELIITSNKNTGIIVKNTNGKLIISELKEMEIPNIHIYNTNLIEIINYVLAYLLEDFNEIPNNNKYISHILNNHYKLLLGKENQETNTEKIEFQIISHFKKE